MPPAARQSAEISLRRVEPRDLPTLFRQQSDPESNAMAGTVARTAEAFDIAWEQNFANPRLEARVILMGSGGVGSGGGKSQIVGAVSCFQRDGRDLVGYWIAKEHWGKGIASRALGLLLKDVPRRPLGAFAAKANAASVRVLERHGFKMVRSEMCEATERFTACEVAEFVLE